MRKILQIIALPDSITVYVLKKDDERVLERRMTVKLVEGPNIVSDEIEKVPNPGEPRTTQLVALVQDGQSTLIEPVLPDGDTVLPVGDIEGLEIVKIKF